MPPASTAEWVAGTIVLRNGCTAPVNLQDPIFNHTVKSSFHHIFLYFSMYLITGALETLQLLWHY